MSFTFIRQLPTPDVVKALEPMSEEMAQIKAGRDQLIRDVITGKSDKFLVIVGPCSADNEDAVCEYTNRLAEVQEKVADRLVIVPRIYTNKPRTTGEGYKGMLHQPDPEAKPDILTGILAIRRMHIRSISETGLTAADEMLYPDNWHYLSDILSYVAIGARSVENQEHRLMVSGLDIRNSKPDPEVFLLAARNLGVAPEMCLVVEDAVAGVEAAHRGGMDAAAMGDAARSGAGEYTLNQFAELLDIAGA